MGIVRSAIGRFRRRGDHVTVPHGSSLSPAPRRRTFLDDRFQSTFEDQGFVVVDLLDDPEVGEVRRRYDALDHRVRESYDWVQGFDTSIYDPRRGYRHEVLAVIEESLSPRLGEVLDRYRIMFANFVVKQPDSEPVPLHVDWTFLDEAAYSSVTVWCPLVDTTLRNGTLGVVAGSHHRIDFVRAANVPSFERCEEAVADIEERPVIPLRAGQAIVLDNRVVHFSPPNRSEHARVAIGCVAGPTEAKLHHYWQDSDEQMLRFEIDRTFYLSYMIGSRPSESDGVISVSAAAVT